MNDKIRLPAGVRPVNYDLFFDIDMEKLRFSGKERIDVKIGKPTSEIIMHASGLRINDAYAVFRGEKIKAKIREYKKHEKIMLNFGRTVSSEAVLFLEFAGKITDSMTGLYCSKYQANGKEKRMATTQFEPSYARRAFPCFDEPALKATFGVTMKIGKKMQAISNMPAEEERIEGGKKMVTFNKTPRMPTYLLYLGAGEFEFLEGRHGKVRIRVAITPGKKSQARFALDMTKKFMEYFEGYSDIKYPLPKLDMIAIPDFASGAMENWGAITFREVTLLSDPKVTSVSVKKRIAEVIAHELWHQWSGNLVTMEWWNDLWLNESFATFMAYKAVDHYFPEWETWKDFMLNETDTAFDADSIKNTHPIEVGVTDPREINEIFDLISYNKGGSVLRMIESYMGKENFRKGVSKYLTEHKYGNATADDLWISLESASGQPIKNTAAAWIRQPGYPLVSATLKGKNLLLSQKRFVFNARDRSLWPVPLAIKSGKKIFTGVMNKREKKIALGQGWFKANYGQTCFYRVKYDERSLSRLKPVVAGKKLPAVDRWGVQSDLFRLSRHGEITIDKYLDFIKAYANEDDYMVLRSVFDSLHSIYFVFSQEKSWSMIEPGLTGIFKENFARVLEKLGWEPKAGEAEKNALLRNLAIGYLGFARHRATRRTAMKKFERHCRGKPLHPNIRAAVFSLVSDSSDAAVYEKLLKVYGRSHSPEERIQVLAALGNFRDPKLLKRALDFSISSKVRKQDFFTTFAYASGNPESRSILLKWAERNWKQLESYKQIHHSIFFHIIESLITAYVTEDKEAQLRQFFRAHPVEYKMTLGKSFDRLNRNVFWLKNNRKALAEYFGARVN